MNKTQRILEEITRISIELLLKEPFYSHLLSRLNKKIVDVNDPVKSIALGWLDKNPVIYVNPVYWDVQLTNSSHRYGLLKHEILHIVFKHILVNEPYKDRDLMYMAMDLAINQYILKENLPEKSLFIDTFPELDLEKGKSWRYYYEKLLYLVQNLDALFEDTVSAANYLAVKHSSHGLERHVLWKAIEKHSDIDRTLSQNIIDYLIETAHAKTPDNFWSSTPDFLKLKIKSLLEKPSRAIHWRRALKIFTASGAKTKIRTTLKRPSRRYGKIPGIKIQRKQRLLVAADTSGSIEKQDLEIFFSEIYHLWRSGAEIFILECDSKIRNQYHYQGQTPEYVQGRGATNFNEPIQIGNSDPRPDGLIYFTDGRADPPQVKARFPILWIISKNGLDLEDESIKRLPGRKVKIRTF